MQMIEFAEKYSQHWAIIGNHTYLKNHNMQNPEK